MSRSGFGHNVGALLPQRPKLSWLVAVLWWFAAASAAIAQNAPGDSTQERAAVLAQRDTLIKRAIDAANRREFSRSDELFGQVIEIEARVFGNAHEERLKTLDWQAQIANVANDYQGAVEYRRRAYEMGKRIYPADAYQLKDLQVALDNDRIIAGCTNEQRERLSRAAAATGQVSALYQQGKSREAIVLATQALEEFEQVLGKEHDMYATTLGNLAALNQATGNYGKAESLYGEAMVLRAKVLGKQHPDYATLLNNFAELSRLRGKFDRAEELHIEARTIRLETLGKEHPAYANTLTNLALLRMSLGNYTGAEPLLIESKGISERNFGRQHPTYAHEASALGELYRLMGDYSRAEPLLVEAMEIREKVLGKEHPEYASSVHTLAILYDSMGDHGRALPLYLLAKETRARLLGENHPSYAVAVSNLGEFYLSIGDYRQAEPLFIESKAIVERTLGKQHPSYGSQVSQLARLYSSMGDYAHAAPLFQESKSIAEKVFGKHNREYASAAADLGRFCREVGDYQQAEALFLESKSIYQEVLGKKHPSYAMTVHNLAQIYALMGQDEQAETFFLESKAILEDVLGKQHHTYANSLNNLATFYAEKEDFVQAESLLVESHRLQEQALGKENPDCAHSLNNLATLYFKMGDFARAEQPYRESLDILTKHLEATAYSQSEHQQLLMSQTQRHKLDNYLACCLDGELEPDHAVELLVLWKGAIMRRARRLRLASNDPVIATQFEKLQSVASQLSSLSRSIPEPQKIAAWKQRIDDLRDENRRLEVNLSRRSSSFRDASRTVSFEEIRQAIPSDAVLVDFLEFIGHDGPTLSASIIQRDGDLKLIDLGSAEVVGNAIDTWRKSFGMTTEGQAAAAQLREQLWQPLLEHVSDAELILVSTDGVLGRLPLAALPGAKPNTYLIEDHRLSLLPVPQMLPELVRRANRKLSEYDALLVGEVDFGEPVSEEAWPSLAETGKELDFIKQLVGKTGIGENDTVNELRRNAATESAFRALAPKCELLHLATHGFFATAEKQNALSAHMAKQAYGLRQDGAMRSGDEGERVVGYSPGQLSGLVFAGANRESGPVARFSDSEPIDDGIMTADEIAYLPLEQTELAVLSACETGLGEVAGGEGLIGIQRAFQVAGADSVVATLWKVDDLMTRKLMQRFYQNLFTRKMSKLDALRDAQLWILRHPDEVTVSNDRGPVRKIKPLGESENVESGPNTNPYFWAPFVLSGDWR